MERGGIAVIVVGGLNTDIAVLGVDRLLADGELTRSGRICIGPGGKSCNMARMIAPLIAPLEVAMVGRTSRDPFGLWQVPVEALREAGVNTDLVITLDYAQTGLFPGIALIPVDTRGRNRIYCVPGVNDLFQPEDMERASGLFESVGERGILVLSMELPTETAVHAVRKASSCGLRVILDPGGINESEDYSELLGSGIYVIVPNEHEASILSGVEVTGMEGAREAARSLMGHGIANVLITHGGKGAYAFTGGDEIQIAAGGTGAGPADETGCGDQVTAVICSEMLRGAGFMEASRAAVAAGSLQYCRPGITPLTRGELDAAMRGSL